LTPTDDLVYWQRMRPRTSAAGRARVILGDVLSASILAVLVSWIAGCITIDGTLRADGTGTMSFSYVAPPGSSETSQRALLQATGITIQSLTLGDDRKLSATLAVDNLAAISKTALFRNVTVSTSAEGDDQVLTIKVVGQPKSVRDKTIPGPKIGITLPGTVVEANENATVSGSHVEWSISLADWMSRAAWELKARYRPTKAGDAASADGKSAPAPSGASKPEPDAK
jgi:hypothetical protein